MRRPARLLRSERAAIADGVDRVVGEVGHRRHELLRRRVRLTGRLCEVPAVDETIEDDEARELLARHLAERRRDGGVERARRGDRIGEATESRAERRERIGQVRLGRRRTAEGRSERGGTGEHVLEDVAHTELRHGVGRSRSVGVMPPTTSASAGPRALNWAMDP